MMWTQSESKPSRVKFCHFLYGTAICLLLASSVSYARSIDMQNTRSFSGGPINPNTVGSLQLNWTYQTTPDTGTASTPLGSISSTPAVKGKFLYFNDYSGNITKLNRFTGQVVWVKNYIQDIADFTHHFGIVESRVTPYISGNLVIVGSNYGITATLCAVTGGAPSALGCHTGDGAIVVALNKKDGSVVWRAKADTHPAGKVTGSISGNGSVIFVPIGNWEEDWSRSYPNIYQRDTNGNIDPTSKYPCCSARGSLVAMDVSTGKILWKTYVVPGNAANQTTLKDPNDKNAPVAQNLLPLLAGRPASGTPNLNYIPANPGGFFGASTYGHNPTIDTQRQLVYIATAQNETASFAAEDCEKARRLAQASGTQPIDPPYLQQYGLTCGKLNDALHNYASAVLALDMNTGLVKWVFRTRSYDAWNHACAAPDFYGLGNVVPIVFSLPLVNTQNCFQDPVGPDLGFGQQPMLLTAVKMPNGTYQDLVVVGNKDGRLFAINPNNGKKIWEKIVDPGGIYGGLQFGRATDGKTIYFGTVNTQNFNRDINQPFVSATDFLQCNRFTNLLNDPAAVPLYGTYLCQGTSTLGVNAIRVGLFSQGDNAPLRAMPGPTSQLLPFPGPATIYGSLGLGYPTLFPANAYEGLNSLFSTPLLSWPTSGPVVRYTLTNPPADVIVDGKTVFSHGGQIKTINGMIEAVDAATGNILWQRPANDGIGGTLQTTEVHGTLTVGNGLVFIGYVDTKGTMVALDAKTGTKLFQFQNTIPVNGVATPAGGIESGPQVVGRRVYWGAGTETFAPFPDKTGTLVYGGNRLFSFILPPIPDDEEDRIDRDTDLED